MPTTSPATPLRITLCLMAGFALLVLDVLLGLPANLYGWGREPLAFAVGTLLLSAAGMQLGCRLLGMMALVLCGAWLLAYPHLNGFDVVFSPLLVLAVLWTFVTRNRKDTLA